MQKHIILISFIVIFNSIGNFAFAMCDHDHQAKIQGKWVLEAIDGEAVSTKNEIYFEIDGNIITGFDGCNKFGGNLEEPLKIRTSQRGCIASGPKLPLELPDPRAQLESATVKENKLIIPLSNGNGEAIFRLGSK